MKGGRSRGVGSERRSSVPTLAVWYYLFWLCFCSACGGSRQPKAVKLLRGRSASRVNLKGGGGNRHTVTRSRQTQTSGAAAMPTQPTVCGCGRETAGRVLACRACRKRLGGAFVVRPAHRWRVGRAEKRVSCTGALQTATRRGVWRAESALKAARAWRH